MKNILFYIHYAKNAERKYVKKIFCIANNQVYNLNNMNITSNELSHKWHNMHTAA